MLMVVENVINALWMIIVKLMHNLFVIPLADNVDLAIHQQRFQNVQLLTNSVKVVEI